MDATTLRAVLTELRSVLLPSRFEKAQQNDPQTLQLALRHLDGVQWLEAGWLAEAPRLLAIGAPPRQGEGSTLAKQLQHGLKGLALVAIEQQGWERVVELVFARRPGDPPERRLVLELMGRHSNLFLLDSDSRVIATAHQVRPSQSRQRPIGCGDRWVPPPPLSGDQPRLEESQERWRQRLTLVPLPLGRALMATYQGISPALARQISGDLIDTPVASLDASQWPPLHRRWQRWLQAVQQQERQGLRLTDDGGYCCWDSGSPEAPNPLALNLGLARYYGPRLEQSRFDQRRHALNQSLRSLAERERCNLEQQQQLLAAVPEGESLQHRADTLLSQRSPSREAIDEAQALYRLARKRRRSAASITPRLELHQERLAWIEASLTFLDQAETSDQLADLADELDQLPGRKPVLASRSQRRQAATAQQQGQPVPLEVRTASGLRLQVGRNHRQNEWISLRQARRGDLWFHAQEIPGSHVVLKASEGPAGEADLRAAADLAAHFSRARGNVRVPVIMVPTEDLQRLPGAAAGTVRHRGGKVVWGEPSRALSLLGRPSLA
jgi:predicted ribosome quality control (RQC) complex YloA/Tae2 family protein